MICEFYCDLYVCEKCYINELYLHYFILNGKKCYWEKCKKKSGDRNEHSGSSLIVFSHLYSWNLLVELNRTYYRKWNLLTCPLSATYDLGNILDFWYSHFLMLKENIFVYLGNLLQPYVDYVSLNISAADGSV